MNNEKQSEYTLDDYERDCRCGKHLRSCLMTKMQLLETQARLRHLRWENRELRRTNARLKKTFQAKNRNNLSP